MRLYQKIVFDFSVKAVKKPEIFSFLCGVVTKVKLFFKGFPSIMTNQQKKFGWILYKLSKIVYNKRCSYVNYA